MSDPYSVLGVKPDASDDAIKRAYRELARKYHPDNYQNNPLADLAEEKMKEINQAYDTITKMRSGGGSASGGYQSQGSYQYQGGYQQQRQYSDSASGSLYSQVRQCINLGDIGPGGAIAALRARSGCGVAFSHRLHRLPEGLAGRGDPTLSDGLQYGSVQRGVPSGHGDDAPGGAGLPPLRLWRRGDGYLRLLHRLHVRQLPVRRLRELTLWRGVERGRARAGRPWWVC